MLDTDRTVKTSSTRSQTASRWPTRAGWAILMAPSALTLLGCFLAPLAVVVIYSFYRFDPSSGEHAALVGTNYASLGSTFYLAVLWKTCAMAVAVVALAILFGFPIAYTYARSRSRFKGLLLIFVLIPFLAGVIVRTFGWVIIFSDGGVASQFFSRLGLPPYTLLFTYPGTVIALTEVFLPFMVFSQVSVLQQIPINLEEASRLLGAGRWRVFRDVIWPLSLPGTVAGAILVFVQSISAFATPALVGGSNTVVIATLVYQEAKTALNWPLASAIGTTFSVLVLGLAALQGSLLRATAKRRTTS